VYERFWRIIPVRPKEKRNKKKGKEKLKNNNGKETRGF